MIKHLIKALETIYYSRSDMDTKKIRNWCNTSRNIIRYFSTVASEDPVDKYIYIYTYITDYIWLLQSLVNETLLPHQYHIG